MYKKIRFILDPSKKFKPQKMIVNILTGLIALIIIFVIGNLMAEYFMKDIILIDEPGLYGG